MQRGDQLGLIHGVPVGLKDIFYTEGMLTACGSKVYADFVPEFDATSVAKIKAAGGIILGKAVTTEFATSDPSPTRNPWNLEHTSGAVPAAGRLRRWRRGWFRRRWVRRPAGRRVGRRRTTASSA